MDMQTKEARMILPLADNNGAPLSHVHAWLEGRLLAQFGGFTVEPIKGAWRDEATNRVYYDESLRYTIAAQWSDGLAQRLESIAYEAKLKAEQECIYVQHATGAVVYVTTELFWQAA